MKTMSHIRSKKSNSHWQTFREGYVKICSISWIRKVIFTTIASLPVIIYLWRFAITYRHGIFVGEDWDLFAQSYEAARITIVHYHQFPWWNPWSIGGEPLFANPQFGLFSLQMPLILLFGTVIGLHLSLAVYFFLGFWGMYQLLKRLGTNLPIRTLLSYTWTFSSFPALHLSGGHYTFTVYLLAPWVLLSLLNVRRRRGWLWFALAISLIINTAIHYMTIQLLMIVTVLVIYEFLRYRYRNKGALLSTALPYIKAGCLILILVLPKVIYTLQFAHEFPRLDAQDDVALPISFFVAALTARHAINPRAYFQANWSWTEYGDYIGVITFALLCYMFVKKLLAKAFALKDVLLLLGIVLTFLLFLGQFARFSPYSILHHLPFLSQMRVPSRYVAWFALGAVVLLGQLPKRKLVYALLLISVMDVFGANYGIINYSERTYAQPTPTAHSFQQYAYFEAHGAKNLMALNSFRLLRATQSNYGEVYGYEPQVGIGEYYVPITIRCGINQGCNFVKSNNAQVIYWSPNKIILKRTAPGPIELSMNPGKVWKVNGAQPFKYYRILELGKPFLITDSAKSIVVTFAPKL